MSCECYHCRLAAPLPLGSRPLARLERLTAAPPSFERQARAHLERYGIPVTDLYLTEGETDA